MNPRTAVERFLTAFYTGDEPAILNAIIPGFQMFGPFATAHNSQELIELSRPLFDVVHGVRVQRWIVEGAAVSALYDIALKGPAGSAWMTMGGWFTVTVTGDRVAEGHVIYDSAAFHAALSGQ